MAGRRRTINRKEQRTSEFEEEATEKAEEEETEDEEEESDDEEEHLKPVYPARTSITEVDIDFDDEYQSLAHVRTVSRHSPPELIENDDLENECIALPPPYHIRSSLIAN